MNHPYKEMHYKKFAVIYSKLMVRFMDLAKEDPEGYMRHEDAIFFVRLHRSMVVCLTDPMREDYRCGNTLARQVYQGKPLGKGYAQWRRIKKGMPQRYRLFFQFSSEARKLIFTWLNDGRTLRQDGSKSDVYAVFARLIASGKIPNPFTELRTDSKPV